MLASRRSRSHCVMANRQWQSGLSKFQIVEHLDASLAGTSPALRVGAGHNAASGDRVIVEGANRSAVERSSRSDSVNDGNDSIGSQLIKDSEDEFAFNRESGHGLAVDDRFAGLGVDDVRRDRRTMANGANDAAAVSDIRGSCL